VDSSAVTGFAEAEESDVIIRPDPSTLAVLPWSPESAREARMFCDIYKTDGIERYEGDSRYILKRIVDEARDLGFDYMISPEIEYFYFKDNKSPQILDKGTYYEHIPNDDANNMRLATVSALERMGISVSMSHHEVAPSQHEIDLHIGGAMDIADAIITTRYAVKEIALEKGYYATFMPKPIEGQWGSGMHTHQALFNGKKNAFYDGKDPEGLSEVARGFIAGQLRYAREICIFLNQWINSFKRLVPGYEAPVVVSWARKNRTALIRVVEDEPKYVRAELRCLDPACNPYLAFAVMLASGLSGVKGHRRLPAPVEPTRAKIEMTDREKSGLRSLPTNLLEAAREAENSKLVKDALGEHVLMRYIHKKYQEWEPYRTRVSQFELDRYYGVL
jgi:glutamine synthetase